MADLTPRHAPVSNPRSKSRDWFMTIHPTVGETNAAFHQRMCGYGTNGLPGADVKYLLSSVEIGSDSLARAVAAGIPASDAVPHGHILIVFTNATTGKSALDKLGGVGHYERKRGTYEQAITYIKKV